MFIKIFYDNGNIAVYEAKKYLNLNNKSLLIRVDRDTETEVAIETGVNSVWFENDSGKTVDSIAFGLVSRV